ncbi:MAG: WG repeat-containing protein [Planctomycetaceae bacterium]|nr:WG repeat-containing protein [Planctomycetaceae bacterium]
MPYAVRHCLAVFLLCILTATGVAGTPDGGDGIDAALAALNYAVDLVDEGAVAEAVAELDGVIAKYGNHDDATLRELARQALYLKVVALGQTDDHAAIVAASDDFIATADGDESAGGAQVASALLHRALAFSSLGESERELADYRRIIAMYRHHPDDDMAEDAAAAMRNLGISLREAGDRAAGDALLNEMRILFAETRMPGALLHLAVAMQNIQQTMIDNRGRRSVAEAAALAREYGEIIDRHRDGDDPQTNEALARMMYAKSALLYLAGDMEQANALGAELADRFKYEIEGDIRMVVASAMAQRGIILGAKADKSDAIAALDDYIAVFSDAWEPEILDQMALVLLTRIRYLVASGDSEAVVAACDGYLRRHAEGGNPGLSRFLSSVEETRREAMNNDPNLPSRVLVHIQIPSTSRLTHDIAEIVEAVTAGSDKPIPARSVVSLANIYLPLSRFFTSRDVAVDWVICENRLDEDDSWALIIQRWDFAEIQTMLDAGTLRSSYDEENDAAILQLYRGSAHALSRHGDGFLIASDVTTLRALRQALASGWQPGVDSGDPVALTVTPLLLRRTQDLAPDAFLRRIAASLRLPDFEFPASPALAEQLSRVFTEAAKGEGITVTAAREGDTVAATVSLAMEPGTVASCNGDGESYSGAIPAWGLTGAIDVTMGGILPDDAVETLRGWLVDIGWTPSDGATAFRAIPGADLFPDTLDVARLGLAVVDANALNAFAFNKAAAAAGGSGDPEEEAAVRSSLEKARAAIKTTDVRAGFALTCGRGRVELRCRIPLAAANAVYGNRLAIGRVEHEARRAWAKVRDGDPIAEAIQAASVGEPPAALAALSSSEPLPRQVGKPVADPAAELAPYPHDGKWGFVDAHGQAVVPFRFEYVRPFGSHGRAPVQINGRWGFIDASGAIVVPTRFEDARSYGECALAPVKLDGAWQYIDLEGNDAIGERFTEAHSFSPWGGAWVEQSGKKGFFINKRGECIGTNPHPDFADNGLAPFRTPYPGEKMGYINRDRDVVIEPRFRQAFAFGRNGLAPVEQDGAMGFIDATGETVIPFRYSHANGFRGIPFAPVQRRDGSCKGYGFVDETGREVVPAIHDDVHGTPERGYVAMKKDGKWGLWNMDGTLVWPYEYDRIDGYITDPACIRVKRDGKWGCMNVDGEVVIPLIYDELAAFGPNSITPAARNGRAGFIDKSGKTVIPFEYTTTEPFGYGGLAPVARDGLAGHVDTSGTVVIPLHYQMT